MSPSESGLSPGMEPSAGTSLALGPRDSLSRGALARGPVTTPPRLVWCVQVWRAARKAFYNNRHLSTPAASDTELSGATESAASSCDILRRRHTALSSDDLEFAGTYIRVEC